MTLIELFVFVAVSIAAFSFAYLTGFYGRECIDHFQGGSFMITSFSAIVTVLLGRESMILMDMTKGRM